jgi:hypothetical protein
MHLRETVVEKRAMPMAKSIRCLAPGGLNEKCSVMAMRPCHCESPWQKKSASKNECALTLRVSTEKFVRAVKYQNANY